MSIEFWGFILFLIEFVCVCVYFQSFVRRGQTLEWRSDPKCTHIMGKNYRHRDTMYFTIDKPRGKIMYN